MIHAPSKPLSKGTPLIRRAIQEMRDRGVDLDYVELVGLPNEEVRRELESADFVIDQAFSDTPMAVFATEAAVTGCPAVVGGYELDEVRRQTPDDHMPPSILCKPTELADAVAELAGDDESRTRMGQRAREFVSEQWSPDKVAARLIDAVYGNVDDADLQAPVPNPFTHGQGMSDRRARAAIRAVVESGGTEALCVDDQATRSRLLEFAGLTDAGE